MRVIVELYYARRVQPSKFSFQTCKALGFKSLTFPIHLN